MSVRYHPIIGREHDGKVYTVRDVGNLSGRSVAWLDGKRGCVATEALSPACPECGGDHVAAQCDNLG